MGAQSRRRCGRGGPSPGADVGGVGPVPAEMWRRYGRDGPSPGADVGGVGPVPAQTWAYVQRGDEPLQQSRRAVREERDRLDQLAVPAASGNGRPKWDSA